MKIVVVAELKYFPDNFLIYLVEIRKMCFENGSVLRRGVWQNMCETSRYTKLRVNLFFD